MLKKVLSTALFCVISISNADLISQHTFEDNSWSNTVKSEFPAFVARGAAAFVFDGNRGNVANLESDGWLQGGNQTEQFGELTTQLSLSIWVKSSENNWSDNDRIMGRKDSWFLAVVNNETAGFFVAGAPGLIGNSKINDKKWHHITATWDTVSGERKLYVDGKLDSKDVFVKDGDIGQWSWGYYAVGGRSGSYAAADKIYRGFVDDVRVYNEVVDAGEVSKIFTSAVSLVRPVLRHHGKPKTEQEENLWRQERAQEFFAKLDLTIPSMREVAYAVRKGDYDRAAAAVVKYFEKKDYKGFYLAATSDWKNVAQNALEDRFTLSGFERLLERNKYGFIVWDSEVDTSADQYAAMLSRHNYMLDVLKAYKETSDQKYLDLLNSHLRDWLSNNDYPKEDIDQVEKGKWAIPDTTQWVSLNAALRLTTWLNLWASCKGVDIDQDVKFDMLMSVPEHCEFLRWHHRHDGNFKVAEMKAICESAIAFPEFKNSADWLDYGLSELSNEIDAQFYPDGAQKELAFHYNLIVVGKFNSVAKLADVNGIKIPSDFVDRLENLYLYMATVMKPNGYGLLNNDSDKEYVRDIIKQAAGRYGNQKMMYAGSAEKDGSWPREQMSVVLPWCGQAIFRDGFKETSNWLCFEIGPWGIGHQHNDKLHLSVVVGGRDLLVDGGRYTYTGYHDTSNPWRNYFIGSDAHNVILVDGVGQSAREQQWSQPLSPDDYAITEDFCFARGTYDSGFKGVKNKDATRFAGRAEHTRNVVYVPKFGWIVVDTIDTDRPRDIEVLWHFAPDCLVETKGNMIFTNDAGKGNLLIKPAQEYNVELEIVKGQEQPIQGWHSEKIGVKVPNAVAVYKGKIEASSTFVWLLMPEAGEISEFGDVSKCEWDAGKAAVKFSFNGRGGKLDAVIPVKEGRPEVIYNLKQD